MFKAQFDHYTIKVDKLDESARFYREVLQLSEIENRTRKPHIRWFGLGEGRELHLVEGDTSTIQTNIGVHLALRVDNFEAFMDHLSRHDITPHNSKAEAGTITTRADGVKQVYFQDTNGYWIEVNDAG